MNHIIVDIDDTAFLDAALPAETLEEAEDRVPGDHRRRLLAGDPDEQRRLLRQVALEAGVAVRGTTYPGISDRSPLCLSLVSDASVVTMVIALMRVCPAEQREDLAWLLNRMETQQLGFSHLLYWRDIDYAA